ncbi:serine O-acetyltransferase [Cytophagales bacterium WSM2-2]|nr:serine O-acetyltransferase [Cytophagales bacterium WSM2-2]
MKKLVIYGAGGFGRETYWLITQINALLKQWEVIGYCDDGKRAGEKVDEAFVLGGMSYLNESNEDLNVVLAIADPKIRENIRGKLTNSKLCFPAIVHPSVRINDSCSVGEGSIVCAAVLMTVSVHIRPFSIVNLCCTLGHDCELGDFSSLMPAANISGNVKIGKAAYVGAGATLLQGISIGNYTTIGAGSVVTKSFEGNKRIAGVPARSI